jgi:hypothetical protein
MAWLHVLWDSWSPNGNLAHVKEHGLTANDVETVLRDPERRATSRSTGLPIAFGHLADGRRICVVYEQIDPVTVNPVTAYEV